MSTTETGTPLPFTLAVPDSALADLRTRLALTRLATVQGSAARD